jgi:hypothetical protein
MFKIGSSPTTLKKAVALSITDRGYGFFAFGLFVSIWFGTQGWGLEAQPRRIPLHRPYIESLLYEQAFVVLEYRK